MNQFPGIKDRIIDAEAIDRLPNLYAKGNPAFSTREPENPPSTPNSPMMTQNQKAANYCNYQPLQ